MGRVTYKIALPTSFLSWLRMGIFSQVLHHEVGLDDSKLPSDGLAPVGVQRLLPFPPHSPSPLTQSSLTSRLTFVHLSLTPCLATLSHPDSISPLLSLPPPSFRPSSPLSLLSPSPCLQEAIELDGEEGGARGGLREQISSRFPSLAAWRAAAFGAGMPRFLRAAARWQTAGSCYYSARGTTAGTAVLCSPPLSPRLSRHHSTQFVGMKRSSSLERIERDNERLRQAQACIPPMIIIS